MKTCTSLLSFILALFLLTGCAVTPAATKSKSDKLAKPEKFKVQFFDAHADWRIFNR